VVSQDWQDLVVVQVGLVEIILVDLMSLQANLVERAVVAEILQMDILLVVLAAGAAAAQV
jgi:hypothetical protein